MTAQLDASAVSGGFSDPVFDSQTAFRRLMEAFAQPGTIADLGGLVEAPEGMDAAAAVLLVTLADADASIFTGGPETGAAARWLLFQTGAAMVRDPADAVFALLSAGSDPVGWDRFPIGTDAYPDRSATLLLPVDDLDGGPRLHLAGPGIETVRPIAPRGLPAGFVAARSANAARFPRGHDLVLVAGARCLVLPRSTRIEEA